MKEARRNKVFRDLEILLFAVYLAMLCYFLFFADSMGRTYTERTYHYNLQPLREIGRFWHYRESLGRWAVFLNLGGNVIAFLPFGGFLPRIFEKCRRFFPTLLLTFDFSLCVEIIQLVGKVGTFDVDDILLNTLGGVLGYICYRAAAAAAKHRERARHGGKDEKKKSL